MRTGVGRDPSARRALLVAGGASLVAAPYSLMLLDGDALYPLINEDGWVETLGAVALATAGLVFLAAAFRAPSHLRSAWPRGARVSLVALGALFLFGAGEEVSWGQRQVEAEGPRRLIEANAQGEWTLHNLSAIDAATDVMFSAFIVAFAIALPLAAGLRPGVMARFRPRVPIFPAWIALLFIVNEAAFRTVWWGMPEGWYRGLHPFTQSAHEIRETVASVLFAVAAVVVLRRGPGPDPVVLTSEDRPGVPVRR